MRILENRTKDQALKYFEEGSTMYSHTPDPIMSEVFSKAYEWRSKNIHITKWKSYPIKEVAISLILNEL